MGEPHILTILRIKRQEIEAAIATHEAKVEAAKRDLASLNRTLALFEPRHGVGPTAPYFELGRLWKPGEIARVCLLSLEREGPLHTEQLAEPVAAAKGLDASDERMRTLLVIRVARALSNMRKRGKARAAGKRNGVRIGG